MKKLIKEILMLGIMTFCVAGVIHAADVNYSQELVSKVVAISVGKSDALVKGILQKIDSTNEKVTPFIADDRTMVPIRFISEGFGASVAWDSSSQTATITFDNDVVKITVGSIQLYVNGSYKTMEIAALMKDDRTYVPIKYVVEALSKNIFYDNGLIVISPSDITLDATSNKSTIDYMKTQINKKVNATPNSSDFMGRGSNFANNVDKKEQNYIRPDIIGEVSEVYENEITIKLFNMPERPEQLSQGQTPQNNEIKSSSQQSLGSKPSFSPEYTGETKTIEVDSSTLITMGQRQNSSTTLTISDIKVGDMINAWYSNSSNGLVEKLTVMRRPN